MKKENDEVLNQVTVMNNESMNLDINADKDNNMVDNKVDDILIFDNQKVKLEVSTDGYTVWLTQEQMGELFDRDISVISRHIKNVYAEGELSDDMDCEDPSLKIVNTLSKEGNRTVSREIKYYSLDMIISVGYRVKSKNGIQFRKWATNVLKDYLIKGYTVNEERLLKRANLEGQKIINGLEQQIESLKAEVERNNNLKQIIDIAGRGYLNINEKDSKEILRVISEYTKALDLLDDYDHKKFKVVNGHTSQKMIKYEDCIDIINKLRYSEDSNLFAIERNRGLESIIANIYQTFDGVDIYPSIEEKAVNFLYLVVKNHVFIDGNKRIAATLFVYFLQFYDILYKGDKKRIDNNTLTALTLLIAESNPKEKDVIIELVKNFL